jgi:hypothetical protein
MIARRASGAFVGVALASVELALFALAGLAPAAGCDWRDFDNLQSHTPVLAVGSAAPLGNNDFGRTILPLSKRAAGAAGARFIVSATDGPALAFIDLDGGGHATGATFTSPTFDPLDPLTALAEVPGTNQVVLGAPSGATGTVYLLTLGAQPDVALFDAQPLVDRFGLGVAAGQLAAGTAPEIVVASGDSLTVYLDGDARMAVPAATPPADCPLTMSSGLTPRDRLRRAVLVAPLMGNPDVRQIVIGTPTINDQGAVSVFTVDATSGVASCAFTYRNNDARFGHALAVGDFDGDHVPDLLIGSPPGHAFWIQGPLSSTSPVLPVALASGSAELGSAVAAVDLDDHPGDEALVGDPDANVGNAMLAGDVQVATGPTLSAKLPTVHRQSPSGSDAFGIDVDALPFCKTGCGTPSPVVQNIALVGSASHAFTFFTLGSGGTDPRKP